MTAVHLRCTPTRQATHSEAGPHRNTIFWVGLRNIPHLAVSTHALDALEEAGLFREASLKLPPPRSSLHSRLFPGCLPLQNKGSLWVLCPPRASAPTEARPGTRGTRRGGVATAAFRIKLAARSNVPAAGLSLAAHFPGGCLSSFSLLVAREELRRRDLCSEDSLQQEKNIYGEDTGRKVFGNFS